MLALNKRGEIITKAGQTLYLQRNTDARGRYHLASPQLSRMQSACAVLYCHLWSVSLYQNFRHYFLRGKFKIILKIKYVR